MTPGHLFRREHKGTDILTRTDLLSDKLKYKPSTRIDKQI